MSIPRKNKKSGRKGGVVSPGVSGSWYVVYATVHLVHVDVNSLQ